ncbi:MAG: hypothetical protein J2P17_24170 [Mycobacterium sp.]|nr:hypothetical protein [Mycobacterium sp.]
MADGSQIHMDPSALAKYAMNLSTDSSGPAMQIPEKLADMARLAQHAFFSPSPAGFFAEGALILEVMSQHLSDFHYFVADALRGIACTGLAAATSLATLTNRDIESADNVNAVGFAFGDQVAAPAGYQGDTKTLSQLEAERSPAAASVPMAAREDLSQAALVVGVDQSLTYYHFADGSQVIVLNPGPGYVQTTVVNSAGSEVSVTTTTQSRNNLGELVEVTSRRDGAGTTTTTMTNKSDGSVQVTTTTTSADGKESETSEPVVVKPDAAAPAPEEGPVQQAQDRYHTHGTLDTLARGRYGY